MQIIDGIKFRTPRKLKKKIKKLYAEMRTARKNGKTITIIHPYQRAVAKAFKDKTLMYLPEGRIN